MKALTIYQPWATLVAIGAKKIETRSWQTRYRGPLAIHAALNKRFCDMKSKDYICGNDPFRSVLTEEWKDRHDPLDFMPLGAIVATCSLYSCLPISHDLKAYLSARDLAFGDYTEGRFMWILENIKKIKPVFVRGKMGLWEWEEKP
jgi:hypothetical protein